MNNGSCGIFCLHSITRESSVLKREESQAEMRGIRYRSAQLVLSGSCLEAHTHLSMVLMTVHNLAVHRNAKLNPFLILPSVVASVSVSLPLSTRTHAQSVAPNVCLWCGAQQCSISLPADRFGPGADNQPELGLLFSLFSFSITCRHLCYGSMSRVYKRQ